MATFTWEQAIKVLLPETNSLTNREAVTAEKWRRQDTPEIRIVNGDGKKFAEGFDVSHVIPLTSMGVEDGQYSCVIGFQLDWPNVLDNPQSKFNLFYNDALKPLNELLFASTHNTGAVSYASFDAAMEMVHGVHAWLAKWVPIVKRWEESVDADESEWKGSAAGAFRKFLDVISTEMSKVQLDLAQPQPVKDATGYPDTIDYSRGSGYETLIDAAKTELNRSLGSMWAALVNWWKLPEARELTFEASPVWRMRTALSENMSAAKCDFTWRLVSSGGGDNAPPVYVPESPRVVDNSGMDVGQSAWLEKIELAAKKSWLDNLAPLDKAAQTHMSAVDTAYLALAGALREGIYQPRLQMPTGGGAGGPDVPPGGGPGTGGGAGGPGTGTRAEEPEEASEAEPEEASEEPEEARAAASEGEPAAATRSARTTRERAARRSPASPKHCPDREPAGCPGPRPRPSRAPVRRVGAPLCSTRTASRSWARTASPSCCRRAPASARTARSTTRTASRSWARTASRSSPRPVPRWDSLSPPPRRRPAGCRGPTSTRSGFPRGRRSSRTAPWSTPRASRCSTPTATPTRCPRAPL
ncbi:hypothetical protein [Streptomyces sp. WAC04657]|uniref:hypothetical protein n=1 Tax=Streptomyces sp. WAC04657 TaxID=1779145 RepID=UPI0018FE3FBD|nr:hypothetical protein [Streptomyces sp. WAC04657]